MDLLKKSAERDWLEATTWLSHTSPVAAGSHHYRRTGFFAPRTNVSFAERTNFATMRSMSGASSGDDFLDNLAMHIGQPEITTGLTVR